MPTPSTPKLNAGLAIARAAMANLAELSESQRAECYEVLSAIVPEAEAEQLQITATALRKSAEAQLLLEEILNPPAPLRPAPSHDGQGDGHTHN